MTTVSQLVARIGGPDDARRMARVVRLNKAILSVLLWLMGLGLTVLNVYVIRNTWDASRPTEFSHVRQFRIRRIPPSGI
jgi:hypothetical protein